MEGQVLQKGTEWDISMWSRLELELERSSAPFACVTVKHGALCEGDVPFCIYQDYSVGPGCKTQRQRKTQTLNIVVETTC